MLPFLPFAALLITRVALLIGNPPFLCSKNVWIFASGWVRQWKFFAHPSSWRSPGLAKLFAPIREAKQALIHARILEFAAIQPGRASS